MHVLHQCQWHLKFQKLILSTGEVKQISSINKSIYESIKMGKTEEKYIKTKDNKNLQMWIIYPPDFDPSKKYPALLFCEGGPQSALTQFWSYRWNYQMMAAKGYIVFAPNRRGVSGFGQAWKEQISGDYGGKNMQDYLDATDAMAKEPYVDADKNGCCWSKLWRIFSILSCRYSWQADSKHLFHMPEYSTLQVIWIH